MRLWQKSALALIVVTLVPLGVTTWQTAHENAQELEDSIRDYFVATADLVAGAVRARVERADIEARAIGEVIAQTDLDMADRERLARAQLLSASTLEGVTVYTKGGELVLQVSKPRAAERAVVEPPPSLDLDTRKIAETNGRVVSRVVRRDDDAPIVPIVRPIFSKGEVYAFLWATVDMSGMSQVVTTESEKRFGAVQDNVWLVDERFRVIAAHDPARMWEDARASGVFTGVSEARLRKDVVQLAEHDEGGERMVAALVPLPDLEWGVVVEDTREHAYAAVDRIWRTAAIFGGIFALFALIVGFFAVRRLTAPVIAVSEAAQKVAGGDFSVRVEVDSSDEVGEMAGAFNEMAEDLSDYRDRLVEETRARGNLSRFLSPEVVEGIVAGGDKLKLGGERKQITVMFADVVAFTDLVDEHEPEFVVGILNELFTIITEIVFKHGGIIDKFIGDCAMAIWGAPKSHDDDPARAVRAAEEILRWLEVGNAKWRKELGRNVQLAIGIHSGAAVVGNIGSEKRMEYTAIGDVVNVAARLERLARPGQILITKNTMSQVSGEFDGMSLGNLDIIGRNRTSEIFLLED